MHADGETGFVDVGPPLSPAEAGTLEYELERRGIALRLRICERGEDGDRQAVQVAQADLPAAMAVRDEILPTGPELGPGEIPRSRRWRNAAIAAVLGLVASARVVRIVRVPKGPTTALVILGIAAAFFAAAFGLTKDPPGSGP